MTKEMLLAQLVLAEQKVEELLSQAQVEMTYELEEKMERADLNVWEVRYALASIEHTGAKEATCLILPL